MSGDSPNVHRANDLFELKDGGRSSPTPTTSKDVAAQSSSGNVGGAKAVEASVLVEPNKEKEEEKNELSSATFNNPSPDDSKTSDPDKTIALEDLSYNGKDKDRDDKRREKKKLNGDIDKLDGVWLPKERKKQLQDEEDDSCIVKCLYVTMQCCECTIM